MNPKRALLPLTLAIATLAPCPSASAQIIIIQDRNPVPVNPNFGRDNYSNISPIINNSPSTSPILQPTYPFPNPTQRPYPAPSNTTIIVNPTIIVPGNRVYGYPYPVNSGLSIRYRNSNGIGIQVGY